MRTFFRNWPRRRPAWWRRYVLSAEPSGTLARFALYLAVVLVLHTAAMMRFEGLLLGDALWLTLTTITTVGYGDFSARTGLGRASTVVLVYFGGVFVLFQAAAVYFESRAERRERMHRGRWRWNMLDHIVVLNVPAANTVAYMTRLACEFRASRRFRHMPIQLVTAWFEQGLPEPLHRLGVVHYCGDAWDPEALEAANAREAALVIVLARADSDPASDGRTFDIVDRLRTIGVKARILAECVDDANRPRLRRVGADILVRPMRGYPEMIVRALAAPGAEAILEDLFTSRRDECWRYDIDVSGWRWADLVRILVENDIGVAIAYRAAEDGQVRINPKPDVLVEADKLFVLVREGNARPDQQVAVLLAR